MTSLYNYISEIKTKDESMADLTRTRTKGAVSNSDISSLQSNKFFNIYSFGSNNWGQLCLGNVVSPVIKSTISFPLIVAKVKAVACGWSHSVILVDDNALYQCGNRVATCTKRELIEPKRLKIDSSNSITKIVCGETHSAFLDNRGRVYTWGSNFFGQLGHGDRLDLKRPKRVAKLSHETIVDIASGSNFMLCKTDKGDIYSWGDGSLGALGHGNNADLLAPKMIEGVEDATNGLLVAGDHHAVLIINDANSNDSHFFSWGWNGCGQLGLNDFADRNIPTRSNYKMSGNVRSASCGAAHTVFISRIAKLKTNCVYVWGSNNCGQLGIGIEPSSEAARLSIATPTSVPINETPLEVNCGANHTMLSCENNVVMAAGTNLMGQTGIVSRMLEDSSQNEASSYYGMIDKPSENARSSVKEKTAEVESTAKGLSSPVLMKDRFAVVEQLLKRKVSQIACGGEFTIALTEKEWIPDEAAKECMGKYSARCKGKFRILNRKHHCRICGGIFCGVCAKHFVCIDANNMIRLCSKCYERYNSN